MPRAEVCPACKLPHLGVRRCYRDLLSEALGSPELDAAGGRVLAWLAAVIDWASVEVLTKMIEKARAEAYDLGRADVQQVLDGPRGGAVIPSARTEDQAAGGQALQSGASPLGPSRDLPPLLRRTFTVCSGCGHRPEVCRC